MAYETKEDIIPLGTIDHDFAEYLKSPPGERLLNIITSGRIPDNEEVPKPQILNPNEESIIEVPMRDGFLSQIRVHKKPGSSADQISGNRPLIVLIFGGGFVTGDNTQLGSYATCVANLFDATVVNISYRLAPTFKFPYAPNDVWDTLLWISKNVQTLDANPASGFIIGGVSAGANLAAVTAQKAIDEQLSPPLTGVWLSTPLLFDEEIVPDDYKYLFFSRDQNAESPILSLQAVKRVHAAYSPDIYSPEYSPFNAKNPHMGLPPVFLQVCGMDPLRDDGLIYEKVLRKNGVKTKMEVYPGVPHGYIAFSGTKAARKGSIDSVKAIAWLLERGPLDEKKLNGMNIFGY